MKQYNAIFISDVHMGTKHAQVDKLLTFLKETECRHLYFVGDCWKELVQQPTSTCFRLIRCLTNCVAGSGLVTGC